MCAVFCVSGNSDQYLEKGTLVAIGSLQKTNPWLPIRIIHCNLNRYQKSLFRDYELIEGDISGYSRSSVSLMARPDIDNSVFLRFNLDYLSGYDLALYLDSDLVVLDSLEDIFDFEGSVLCRKMDTYPLSAQFVSGEDILTQEGIPKDLKAVNAGVIRIDLQAWRTSRFANSVQEKIERYGRDEFVHNDQSLINLVGYSKDIIGFLPKAYNFMMWPDILETNEHFLLKTNRLGNIAPDTHEGLAKIVHWTGPLKPWLDEFRKLPDEIRAKYCGPCYDQFT